MALTHRTIGRYSHKHLWEAYVEHFNALLGAKSLKLLLPVYLQHVRNNKIYCNG